MWEMVLLIWGLLFFYSLVGLLPDTMLAIVAGHEIQAIHIGVGPTIFHMPSRPGLVIRLLPLGVFASAQAPSRNDVAPTEEEDATANRVNADTRWWWLLLQVLFNLSLAAVFLGMGDDTVYLVGGMVGLALALFLLIPLPPSSLFLVLYYSLPAFRDRDINHVVPQFLMLLGIVVHLIYLLAVPSLAVFQTESFLDLARSIRHLLFE